MLSPTCPPSSMLMFRVLFLSETCQAWSANRILLVHFLECDRCQSCGLFFCFSSSPLPPSPPLQCCGFGLWRRGDALGSPRWASANNIEEGGKRGRRAPQVKHFEFIFLRLSKVWYSFVFSVIVVARFESVLFICRGVPDGACCWICEYLYIYIYIYIYITLCFAVSCSQLGAQTLPGHYPNITRTLPGRKNHIARTFTHQKGVGYGFLFFFIEMFGQCCFFYRVMYG